MTLELRRSFSKKVLGSALTYGLIETLYAGNLLAGPVKPITRAGLLRIADCGLRIVCEFDVRRSAFDVRRLLTLPSAKDSSIAVSLLASAKSRFLPPPFRLFA